MFFNFKKHKLDERQLLIRGNIYFKNLLIMASLISINFFIKQFLNFRWTVGDWDYMLITLGMVIAIVIQLLYYDIYPLFDNKYRLFFWGIGLYGFIFGILNAGYDYAWNAPLLLHGSLTEKGSLTIFFSYYVILFIVYLILAHQYKIAERNALKEDE